MLNHKMELFYQWDFKRNDELGLDVYKITYGSGKVAWWNCPKCKSPYDMGVVIRVGQNQNCPYCRGLRVNHTNSLASLRPDIAIEWHPTLNGKMSPDHITAGSSEKIWWLGSCRHEWNAVVNDRCGEAQSNCPYCSRSKLLVGFNDTWTTNPSLASLLLNQEDGYRYMQSSKVRVDWKCPECENTIKNKPISRIKSYGLSCPRCKDGVSFPEKFIYNILIESNIVFEFEKTFHWSGKLRYDFYLSDYNWIIEVHGGQHYGIGFSTMGSKTLEEEIENDKLKESLAKENSIDKYIVIDARESTVEHLRGSVMNSPLIQLVPDINFIKIGQLASKTFIKTACDLWESGVHNTREIAENMRVSQSTVLRYLNRGVEIGWCSFSPELTMKNRGIRKSVIQLTLERKFIKEWSSIKEATENLGIDSSSISKACKNGESTAGGFKWTYKEDCVDISLTLRSTQSE